MRAACRASGPRLVSKCDGSSRKSGRWIRPRRAHLSSRKSVVTRCGRLSQKIYIPEISLPFEVHFSEIKLTFRSRGSETLGDASPGRVPYTGPQHSRHMIETRRTIKVHGRARSIAADSFMNLIVQRTVDRVIGVPLCAVLSLGHRLLGRQRESGPPRSVLVIPAAGRLPVGYRSINTLTLPSTALRSI
jgi:hypothetical protein